MQVLQQNPNIPPFLGKLWKMVNDPKTDHLISWGPAGNTFIIQNQVQFWYELLPVYYKHNNMSSFVRQLNLYGFHKISTIENSSSAVGSDKEDLNAIQFYHPFFQRDEPELLKSIKRKAVSSKAHDVHGVVEHDDLTKVLTDVKQLRGRQSNVDSQLSAMKQENAVLWRELAILRQKHMKQQQIVNKLIQFLVTLVQPTASPRMGVGVKRRMPLMLHENPVKKNRIRKNSRQPGDGGPTIHELDPEVNLSPEQLLEEADSIEENIPLEAAVANLERTNEIDSPITPSSQATQDSAVTQPITSNQNDVTTIPQEPSGTESTFWDKPEFVDINDVTEDVSDSEEDLMNTLEKSTGTAEKVFLNANNRNTLIGNDAVGDKNAENDKEQPKQIGDAPPSMEVAKKKFKITSGDDLDIHLDSTDNELDQLKDILSSCNTFDAMSLLGLFSDNEPQYAIRTTLQDKGNSEGEVDPLVAGAEVTPASNSNIIDFNELFDDDLDSQDATLSVQPAATFNPSNVVPPPSSTLNTPVIVKSEPKFPSNT